VEGLFHEEEEEEEEEEFMRRKICSMTHRTCG